MSCENKPGKFAIAEGVDFSTKSVLRLVRLLRFKEPESTGKHPFAKLLCIEEKLKQAGSIDCDENRGNMLEIVVVNIIKDGFSSYPQKIHWRILNEIILHDKTLTGLESELAMSRSTIQRRTHEACALLGRRLLSLEGDAAKKLEMSKDRGEENKSYSQYLRWKHPDWDEEKIQDRLKIAKEVLADLSSIMAQSK